MSGVPFFDSHIASRTALLYMQHMRSDIQSMVFVCTANACRSQMAEGLARAMVPDGIAVYSAGTMGTQVNATAIEVMHEIDIDISGQTSNDLSALPDSIDLVVTVCDSAQQKCPYLVGAVETVHWSIPDPYAIRGSDGERLFGFRKVRDDLKQRIKTLLDL